MKNKGSWKIAYADFTTAMMSFFILMWLLNVTDTDKESVAKYFGFSGHDSKKGASSAPRSIDTKNRIDQVGSPSGGMFQGSKDGGIMDQKAIESTVHNIIKKKIPHYTHESLSLEQSIDSRKIEIHMIDYVEKPMFKPGSHELTEYAINILSTLAPLINQLPYNIMITGYATDIPIANIKYSNNWELSSMRANAVRMLLIKHGVQSDKITAVLGKGDTTTIVAGDSKNPLNMRASITLVR